MTYWTFSKLITDDHMSMRAVRLMDHSPFLSTTYLVELKFTTDQAVAPDIDTFYKKVTTKADNTMVGHGIDFWIFSVGRLKLLEREHPYCFSTTATSI